MSDYGKRIEELCERANEIVQRILEDDDGFRLWYVYDALSAELYQTVMWYNGISDDCINIEITGDYGDPLLVAADYDRVFDLFRYHLTRFRKNT